MFKISSMVGFWIFLLFAKENHAQQDWTSRVDHLPTSRSWGVFSNNDKIIARTFYNPGAGYYTASNDGVTWTQGIIDSNIFASVVWTGTSFFAISYNLQTGKDDLLASTDGILWAKNNTVIFDHASVLTWTGTELIVGDYTGTIYTSQNGVTWKKNQGALGYNDSLQKPEPVQFLTYSRSLYFAKGVTDLFTSPDGKTWTRRKMGNIGFLECILFDGKQFFAFYSDELYTSPDGITWRKRGSKDPLPMEIFWTGSLFVTYDIYGNLQSSTDGLKWSPNIIESSPGNSITGITGLTWNGKKFYAVTNRGMVLTSRDGVAWEVFGNPNPYPNLNSIASSNFQSVAVGEFGVIFSSLDGISWNAQNSGIKTQLRSITWSGTQFVAVGDLGAILTSPTGEAWTIRSSGIKSYLRSVDWTGNQFLAGGDSGKILTSPDGINWTLIKLNTNNVIWAVKGNGTLMVAGGEFADLFSSQDGVKWTQQITGRKYGIKSIVWTGSKFIAVGGSSLEDQVISSSDGVSWSLGKLPFKGAAYSIIKKEGELVTLVRGTGASYSVFTSQDGLKWSFRAQVKNVNSITWTGTQFITVGANKYIYTSPSTSPTKLTLPSSIENTFSVQISPSSLFITLPTHMQNENSKLRVYSLTGHTILERDIPMATSQMNIPLPEITKGLYFMEVSGSKQRLFKRVSLIR